MISEGFNAENAETLQRLVSRICLAVFLSVFIVASPVFGQAVDKDKMAAQVKTEFKHAWDGYKQYCWGHDDLKPISRTCRDWYGTPILMTPG